MAFPYWLDLPLVILLVCVVVGILVYLCGEPDRPPTITCADSPLSQYVIGKCPVMTSPFRPAFWARNTHVQTVLCSLIPPADVTFQRDYVDLEDGGVLALDWALGVAEDRTIPVLVILPGLTGDAQGMSHLCALGLKRNFRSVVFNKRGHGGSRITTPWLQSHGDPTDFRAAILHIRRKYPDAALTAVGHSAGSGLLVSYLGEYGSDCHLATTVCVSPGYDSKYLFEHALRQPYDYILLRSLKQLVVRHADILAGAVDVPKVLASPRMAKLEENLYAKLYGHKTMDDYWDRNNPIRNIPNIRVPTLCISGLDDPVCKKECIRYSLFLDHENFILLTPTRGGHCGFLEGSRLERWADRVAMDYITAVLSYS